MLLSLSKGGATCIPSVDVGRVIYVFGPVATLGCSKRQCKGGGLQTDSVTAFGERLMTRRLKRGRKANIYGKACASGLFHLGLGSFVAATRWPQPGQSHPGGPGMPGPPVVSPTESPSARVIFTRQCHLAAAWYDISSV